MCLLYKKSLEYEKTKGRGGKIMSEIKGFKVFNPDWTCRGFQYEVGNTYEENVKPSICGRGFHFCKQAKDCFNYYTFDPNNKVAEVIALGEVIEELDKCSTNKIHIVREITWEELLTIVNTGKGNTGFCNTGDRNSGDRNSGYRNTGNWNQGDFCTGDCNTGNRNTGDRNTGDWNTGKRNTGNRNTGDFCTGNRNTGDFCTGNRNTGNWNQGDFCTGDFNITNHETGCFCTEKHKIRFFDKESDMTFKQWRNSEAYQLLRRIQFEPNQWIWSKNMTDEEKAAHPEHEITGGYLKELDTDKAFLSWWEALNERERNIIKNIPNFDANKFFQITGIKVV
jgi:hypothetical protein